MRWGPHADQVVKACRRGGRDLCRFQVREQCRTNTLKGEIPEAEGRLLGSGNIKEGGTRKSPEREEQEAMPENGGWQEESRQRTRRSPRILAPTPGEAGSSQMGLSTAVIQQPYGSTG